MGKVGAPKGGRVHWFLWELPREIAKVYTLRYNYTYHNYALFRFPGKDERKKPIDEFLVIRTSNQCFRVMYYHHERNVFKYFTAKSPKKAGELVAEVYHEMICDTSEPS